MTVICLIHWNEAEAAERLARLRAAGFAAFHTSLAGPPLLRQLRAESPAAILIDLTRLPSHGREVGAALRAAKATRFIPLVFVGGESEKVARVQALLPDAGYTAWEEVVPALRHALANPPVDPVAPASSMAAYAGQPLVTKLGIKAGMRVAAMNAPPNFVETLGELPAQAQIQVDDPGGCELVIWFMRTQQELAQALAESARLEALRALWLAWPKKASGPAAGSRSSSDLTQPVVRETGLSSGWVDYKICAIDPIWSGLLFARRKG